MVADADIRRRIAALLETLGRHAATRSGGDSAARERWRLGGIAAGGPAARLGSRPSRGELPGEHRELSLLGLPSGDRHRLQGVHRYRAGEARDHAVFSVVRDGAFVQAAMGSLVDAPSIRPEEHIFVGSKAAWFEITDDLPQFDEYSN
jgi:hypothetical protein